MEKEHLNPDGLHRNPAFTQAVVTRGDARTVWIGGQNAVDASGSIVGAGDLGVQAKQAFQNLEVVLNAAGGSLADVVFWNVLVVQGQDPEPGLSDRDQCGRRGSGRVVTVFVSIARNALSLGTPARRASFGGGSTPRVFSPPRSFGRHAPPGPEGAA